VAQHPGGDHSLFIGEIVGAGYDEGAEPLIWYGSRYRQLSPEEPA
jgi:flavin reductase (DIM6/NTAB) family NADH-FMN oxidoreductase RutF